MYAGNEEGCIVPDKARRQYLNQRKRFQQFFFKRVITNNGIIKYMRLSFGGINVRTNSSGYTDEGFFERMVGVWAHL